MKDTFITRYYIFTHCNNQLIGICNNEESAKEFIKNSSPAYYLPVSEQVKTLAQF